MDHIEIVTRKREDGSLDYDIRISPENRLTKEEARLIVAEDRALPEGERIMGDVTDAEFKRIIEGLPS